jgi:SAM-dependent methyltransferase
MAIPNPKREAAPGENVLPNSCASCGGRTESFFQVHQVPVNSCVLFRDQEEARSYPTGEVRLTFCEDCGFIGNAAFDPQLVNYNESYEDQQSFSPTFARFAEDLARTLVETYDLHQRDIVEIGCGKGDFLLMLCELGDNRGLGIDPSWIEGRVDGDAGDVRFIRDFYSSRYAHLKADLVCCRHTLEHIPDVGPFLQSVADGVARRPGTLVFIEVPDVVRVLEEVAFWDIYYEHCSYFSPGSLARLFRGTGFQLLSLRRDFGDQYLLLEARTAQDATNNAKRLEESVGDIRRQVRSFSSRSADVMSAWGAFLRSQWKEGKKVAVWGSGSKCVAFLTSLGLREEVGWVVDINPHRHGLYIPGTGHPIRSPEDLLQVEPDVVVVMNEVYRDEIQRSLEEMGLSPRIVALGAQVPAE